MQIVKEKNKLISYSNMIATVGTAILAVTALITVYITVSAWNEEREANRPYFTFKDSPEVVLRESPEFEMVFTNVGEHPAVSLWSKSIVFQAGLKEKPVTIDEYALVNDIPKNASATLLISLQGINKQKTLKDVPPYFFVIVLRYEDPIINESFEQTLYIKWNGMKGGEILTTNHAEEAEKEQIIQYFKQNRINL